MAAPKTIPIAGVHYYSIEESPFDLSTVWIVLLFFSLDPGLQFSPAKPAVSLFDKKKDGSTTATRFRTVTLCHYPTTIVQ